MATHLLAETSTRCLDFASGMIDDDLWRAGRSKLSAARLERVRDACGLGHLLDCERSRRTALRADVTSIDALLSDLAREVSGLAREAIADGSMRLAHFDPWYMTCVDDADALDRGEDAACGVALRAA